MRAVWQAHSCKCLNSRVIRRNTNGRCSETTECRKRLRAHAAHDVAQRLAHGRVHTLNEANVFVHVRARTLRRLEPIAYERQRRFDPSKRRRYTTYLVLQGSQPKGNVTGVLARFARFPQNARHAFRQSYDMGTIFFNPFFPRFFLQSQGLPHQNEPGCGSHVAQERDDALRWRMVQKRRSDDKENH